jgi:hypothetical protein
MEGMLFNWPVGGDQQVGGRQGEDPVHAPDTKQQQKSQQQRFGSDRAPRLEVSMFIP